MHGHSGPDRRHCSRVAFSPRPRSSRRTRDPNAPPRLGLGPHAEQAIRTRQPRPTKATPLRASPDQRHDRPPCPSAFPARATAAVGTHDHSGRHTRHCSRRNTCNRTSPAARRNRASAPDLTPDKQAERDSPDQRKPRRRALLRAHDTSGPRDRVPFLHAPPRRSARTTTLVGTHDTARGSTRAIGHLPRLGCLLRAKNLTTAALRASPFVGPTVCPWSALSKLRTRKTHTASELRYAHDRATLELHTTPGIAQVRLPGTRHRSARHARPLRSAHTTLLAAQTAMRMQPRRSTCTATPARTDDTARVSHSRLGLGPHGERAIRTRQLRATKATPPRACPDPRHGCHTVRRPFMHGSHGGRHARPLRSARTTLLVAQPVHSSSCFGSGASPVPTPRRKPRAAPALSSSRPPGRVLRSRGRTSAELRAKKRTRPRASAAGGGGGRRGGGGGCTSTGCGCCCGGAAPESFSRPRYR